MSPTRRTIPSIPARMGVAIAIAASVAVSWSSTASATDFYGPPSSTVTGSRPSNCLSDGLCVYKDRSFNGQRRTFIILNDSNWNNNTYPDGSGVNDTASSVYNNTNFAIRLFRDDSQGGHVLCLAPYTGVRDLHLVEWIEEYPWGPVLFSMEDRISSSSSHSVNIDALHCNWRARASGCD